MLLTIKPDGTVLSLYDDNLPDLGPRQITRASRVEPDKTGKWFVKLSNSRFNGPFRNQVIVSGLASREAALHYERIFIEEEILCKNLKA
jgi:hypothetical protein